MNTLTLAIDFDQVIHDKLHPVPGRRMGPPLADAKRALIKLKRQKHMIIIHTVMATNPSGQKAVEDWMNYYHLPYDSVTAIKPTADYYVDDKAIRHINWATTMEALNV